MTWAPNGSLSGLSSWMGDPDFRGNVLSHTHLIRLGELSGAQMETGTQTRRGSLAFFFV